MFYLNCLFVMTAVEYTEESIKRKKTEYSIIGVVTADWKAVISIAIIPKVLKRNSFKEQFAVLSLKL